MTADHISGFSKSDPNVKLDFRHKLCKVIFDLKIADGQPAFPLEDLTLSLQGFETTGTYDVLNDILAKDASSINDIVIPYRGVTAGREGIILPRAAGSNAHFAFGTPTGGLFVANMSDTLNLVGGYQYTFYITLKETAISVSAKIEPWIDGPTSYYDAVQIITDAGDSEGIDPGKRMGLYMKSPAVYDSIGAFTYAGDGRWYPDAPIYWQDIPYNPAEMRAAIVAEDKLNTTQLPDYLTSDEKSVPQNTGINFTFSHAASKVIIRLTSTTFTTAELESATVKLPNYLIGGYLDNGAFVPGTVRGDIIPGIAPNNGVALIQPQAVNAGDPIAVVTLAGKDYTAKDEAAALVYNAGEAKIISIMVDKGEVNVSAKVTDWTTTPVDLDASTVGVAVKGGINVNNGEQLLVYTGDPTTRTLLSTFTYDQGGDIFNPSPKVYWESLNNPTTFYASILRTPKPNATQLDDYLIAQPVTVAASNGVAFQLSHPAAIVNIRVQSSDNTFSSTELDQMQLTLPSYTGGATVVNGVFTPGITKNDVTVAKVSGSAYAFIQPQTIAAGQTIVSIAAPNGRVYTVSSASNIEFQQGVATTITIDMKKTPVLASANVIDWSLGTALSMVVPAINVSGSLNGTSDYFRNKTIHLYKLGTDFQHLAYSYVQGTLGYSWTGPTLYWDNFQGQPLNVIAAYFPTQALIPNITNSTTAFDWNLPANQQINSYDDYDLLTSHVTLSTPQYVNFIFSHVLSKVRIEITGEGFTTDELTGMTVVLNNMTVDGSVSMISGAISSTGSTKTVTPRTDVDGLRYSALVMPQTVPLGTPILTVTLKNYPATPFTAALTTNMVFVAGKENVLKVTLRKTGIQISATLEDWSNGDSGEIIIE